MFDNLSERLERSFKILKGEGKITEINVAETLKDVRTRTARCRRELQGGQDVYRHGKAKGIGAERADRRETQPVDGENRTRRTGNPDGRRNGRAEPARPSVRHPDGGIDTVQVKRPCPENWP